MTKTVNSKATFIFFSIEVDFRHSAKKTLLRQGMFFLRFALIRYAENVLQFETISHFLSPREPPPSMLLDRTDDEEIITLPSPTTRRKSTETCVFSLIHVSL